MGRQVCCSSSARAPQHGTTAQRRMACSVDFHDCAVCITTINRIDKTLTFSPKPRRSIRLPDPLRELIRGLHDSLRADGAYVYWVRLFSRWMSGCASLGTWPRMVPRRHEEGSCRTLSEEAYGISLFTMPVCEANPGGRGGQSWLRRQAGGGSSGRAWCGVRACSRQRSTWAATMMAMACGDLSLEPRTPIGQVMRAI